MKEKVFLFLNLIGNGSLALEGLIISALGILLVFLLNLFLSIFSKGHGIGKRIFTLSIGLIFSAFSVVLNKDGGVRIFIFLALISCLINFSVFFIRIKAERGEKEFLSDSHEKVIEKFAPLTERIREVEKIKTETREEKLPVKSRPDFSHVKSVIERLNAFPLSTGDRKQIKELENAIVLIENGAEEDFEINDGLGALLKIMAKYGV